MGDPNKTDVSEWFEPWGIDEWTEAHVRDRGILTDTDRQYLWGITEYDNAVSRSNRRREIRDRIGDSLLDLYYLTKLEEGQREKTLASIRPTEDTGDLQLSVGSLIHFLYLGVDHDMEWLEAAIAQGVRSAEEELDEAERYGYREVDVDIDVSRGYNLDKLEEQLRNGREHELTHSEIGVLVRAGRVNPENLDSLGPDAAKQNKEKD